jgi:AcrR family transcriptional regulator
MFNTKVARSEQTRRRIYEAALAAFREKGFEETTMRAIAARAGVATGAAYYYYESKESIVMAFYEEAWALMQEGLGAAAEPGKKTPLEARLARYTEVKLEAFAPNRAVLRALLRYGADPASPVSPFGRETAPMREADMAWLAKMVADQGLPKDLAPHVPAVLWMYQMGIVMFWLIDESAGQERTRELLRVSAKAVALLLQLSKLPLTRPIRRTAVELIEIVRGVA